MIRRVRFAAGVLALTVVAPIPSGDAQAPASGSVRLSRDETARLAREARERVRVDVAEGLELMLWASDRLVSDPITIDFDARGTAYVGTTTRGRMPLDIRGHDDWVPVVHTLRTPDALRAFYQKVMAPENSERNTWIPDLNGDGSRDIRDFTTLKERIVRVRDTNGDGMADAADVVAEGFSADPTFDVIGSVAYHEGDLYVGISPGMYRLRDVGRPGLMDRKTTISEGYNTHPGYGGHGVSGGTIGPDGRVYWEVGDIGFHVVDHAGRTWEGHNQGGVFRAELDGSGLEVFATGIRNLQEFAFDEHGNLISVDNDGDHPGETERVVYLPYGTDSGWRSNWQYGKYTDARNNRYNVWMQEGMFRTRHVGQTAAILPPIAPWHAGPAGMAYNPGTALSEEWRGHFFAASFAGAADTGRVYGFTLKEDGAGFAMGAERLLVRGILVVGLTFGPDGAMYLTDWIHGWGVKNNGRLWKVDAPADAANPVRREVQGLLAEDFSRRAASGLVPLLGHADMRVRQKAQFDLVRRGDLDTLLSVARDPAHRLARLHALWGVAQLARRTADRASHLVAFLGDGDDEVRAQAAKMLGDVRYGPAADRLLPLLADAAPRVRFFAAEALGRLAYAPAVGPLIEMLAANDGGDAYLHHAGSVALATIGDAGALASLSTHRSAAVRLAAVTALRRMRHPAIALFLADADEHVVTDAARGINDDGSIEAAVPELAARLGVSPVATEPFLRRALNANLRVGSADAVRRVEAFAADPARPQDLRIEALAILGVWPEPSPLDRVDGYYLDAVNVPGTQTTAPGQTEGALAAQQAVERMLAAVAQNDPRFAAVELKVALAEAAGRLTIASAVPILMAQLGSDASEHVRLAALGALQALNGVDRSALMEVALADEAPAVRRAGLAILPQLDIPAGDKARHLEGVVKQGTLVEQQGALEVLGSLQSAEARQLLEAYLDDLHEGRLAAALHVDLIDAVQADGSRALQDRLEAFRQARGADTLVDALRPALLAGGDPRRGWRVVMEDPAGDCTRCHALWGRGSEVGPDLTRIGSMLSAEQILEALVDPNARIAPGFGLVGLTLRNGERIDGTLKEETETEVTLVLDDAGTERRIPKAEIASRTDPVSAMPPLGFVLKLRDLRDVVAFLSRLK